MHRSCLVPVLLVVAACILVHCREPRQKSDAHTDTAAARAGALHDADSAVASADSSSGHAMAGSGVGRQLDDTLAFMRTLAALQHRMLQEVDNDTLRDSLLGMAIDAGAGSIFSAGMGVRTPGMAASAAEQAMQRAAQADAQRNAILTRKLHVDTGPVDPAVLRGTVAYAKKIYSAGQGDTLHALYKIPVGSVETQ